MSSIKTCLCVIAVAMLVITGASQGLTPKEQLGKNLFFDTYLSTPGKMSCATCHAPSAAFADPRSSLPTSLGVIPNRCGSRNSPMAAYAFGGPQALQLFNGGYAGGTFWDGRADNLVEQAKGPFLNRLEMNNPNPLLVVVKVQLSRYAPLFRSVYGQGAFAKVDVAYKSIADAISAYEMSSEVNPCTSKYDAVMAGTATFTPMERMGMMLFHGQGACAQCHFSGSMMGRECPGGCACGCWWTGICNCGEGCDCGCASGGTYNGHPLFTNHGYFNLGTPKNPKNPFYTIARGFNPAGRNYIDRGLGAVLAARNVAGAQTEMGKFKVPSLRNCARTAPYMHNGVFGDLKTVIRFYNTRDIPGAGWGAPEVNHPNIFRGSSYGNIGLTDTEIDALVAFLKTLSDGYVP